MADETVVESARRKKDKCLRTYFNAEGEELGTRAKNDARSVRLQVPAASYDRTLSYDDMPEAVRAAAALYGAVNSITNTIGNAGLSAAEIVENLETRIENIWENGVWAEGAQAGLRTNDVLEAVTRFYVSRGGDASAEWKAKKKQQLSEDKTYNETMRSRPEIAVLIETIRMERQAERLKKAQEKAGTTDSGDLDDLLE